MRTATAGFDGSELYAALDARRIEEGLSWSGVAREVWDLSAELNAKRPRDHPFTTSSIMTLRDRGNANLHATLDATRTRRRATWKQTAVRLGCTPSQLTGLATARYATNMRLAMAITQALRRPAAEFVYVADW